MRSVKVPGVPHEGQEGVWSGRYAKGIEGER